MFVIMVVFFVLQSHTDVLIFLINTFHIKGHKIISKKEI